jgi:surface antigen
MLETSGDQAMKAIILVLSSVLVLGGCTTSVSRTSSLVGFAGTGARSAGTAAIGNGLIGSAQVAGLDPSDRRLALEAEYQALEYTAAGRPVSWTGTNGGVAGEVVASQPYRVGSQDCRQYAHTVNLNGRSQTLRGAACRNEDGSWSLLT